MIQHSYTSLHGNRSTHNLPFSNLCDVIAPSIERWPSVLTKYSFIWMNILLTFLSVQFAIEKDCQGVIKTANMLVVKEKIFSNVKFF